MLFPSKSLNKMLLSDLSLVSALINAKASSFLSTTEIFNHPLLKDVFVFKLRESLVTVELTFDWPFLIYGTENFCK